MRRRVAILLLAGAGTCSATMVTCGCTLVVRPPDNPVDPVIVALVDYGRHSSLILPRPEGGSVEFAYGEWNWFALNRTSVFHAIALIVWPHQGALGRRAIPARPDPEALKPHVRSEELFAIRVGRAEAARLLIRLEGLWKAGSREAVENPALGLTFVKIDDDYLLCSNCNHMTARWLRELGCDVAGSACFSSFRVEPQ
jgi:hypothetical protein